MVTYMQSRISSAIEILLGTVITMGVTYTFTILIANPGVVFVGALIISTVLKYILRRVYNYTHTGTNSTKICKNLNER